MKQREYIIKIHSSSRFIIAFIVLLCTGSILMMDYLPRIENEFISIIQFFAILVTSFYLAHLFGLAKAKVILAEDAFIHIWERRFFLSWEKNFKIPWNIVDTYVFQEDRTFDSFIINLTIKRRYKINQLNVFPIRDDFKKLVKDFPRLSNEFRKGILTDNDTSLIKEGETIYASKSFKWGFYFMTAVFIILVLTTILNPESDTRWSSLGVIGSGILFYGLMIKGQKKNK